MTSDWVIRRCDNCSALESDATVALAFDWVTGEVVHLAGNGLQRCGVLGVVNEVVSK